MVGLEIPRFARNDTRNCVSPDRLNTQATQKRPDEYRAALGCSRNYAACGAGITPNCCINSIASNSAHIGRTPYLSAIAACNDS